jgi:hypothetical protein
MPRGSYLSAKWAGHMLVFGVLAVGSLVVGLVAQYVRAEDRSIDLLELIKPMVLIALPALSVTAMCAVWFDMIPWLRRTFGNIVYFFVWVTTLTSGAMAVEANSVHGRLWSLIGDASGIVLFHRGVVAQLVPHVPGLVPNGICILCSVARPTPLQLFDWTYWHVHFLDIAGRAFWLFATMAGVLIASLFVNAAMAYSGRTGNRKQAGIGRKLHWLRRLLAPMQRTALGVLISAELQLILRQRKMWWWLALAGVCGTQLFAPREIAAIAAILAWGLFLDVSSRALLRERDTATGALVFSAAHASRRVLLARLIMLAIVAWSATLPAIVRFAVSEPIIALTILAVGASLATWGMALAALSGTQRVFELLFCLLAYMSIQGAPILNAFTSPALTVHWHLALLPIAALVLLAMWPSLRRVH